MKQADLLNQNSPGWIWFVKISFGIALAALAVAIVFLPTNVWIKGYLAMGSMFAVATSFILSKTMRDEFEARKIVHQLSEARAERMLRDVDA